jgi:hypothetical protein
LRIRIQAEEVEAVAIPRRAYSDAPTAHLPRNACQEMTRAIAIILATYALLLAAAYG